MTDSKAGETGDSKRASLGNYANMCVYMKDYENLLKKTVVIYITDLETPKSCCVLVSQLLFASMRSFKKNTVLQ